MIAMTQRKDAKKQPAKPAKLPANKLPANKELFTISEVAGYLKLDSCWLSQLCLGGFVPYCRRIDGNRNWLLGRDSVKFLEQWLARRELLGSIWRDTLGRAARAADAACEKLAKQHKRKRHRNKRHFALTELLDILRRRKAGEELWDIAKDYDCDDATISYICSGRSYNAIGEMKRTAREQILQEIAQS